MAYENRRDIIAKAHQNVDAETVKLVTDSEMILQLLELCSVRPGADIIIQIKHSDGHVAVAQLYDHAALVQGLYEAIEYFQSEI